MVWSSFRSLRVVRGPSRRCSVPVFGSAAPKRPWESRLESQGALELSRLDLLHDNCARAETQRRSRGNFSRQDGSHGWLHRIVFPLPGSNQIAGSHDPADYAQLLVRTTAVRRYGCGLYSYRRTPQSTKGTPNMPMVGTKKAEFGGSGQYGRVRLVLKPEIEVVMHPCASAPMGIFCEKSRKEKRKRWNSRRPLTPWSPRTGYRSPAPSTRLRASPLRGPLFILASIP